MPKCFSILEDKSTASGKLPNCYVLNKGHLPSEALKALKIGLAFMDCGGVIDLAEYMALLELLGEAKFNAIFSADGHTPLGFGNIIGKYVSPLTLLTHNIRSSSYEVGQIVHFTGISKLYFQKHDNAEAATFNTICVEGGEKLRFMGLGLCKDGEGVLEERVDEVMLNEYNRRPIGNAALQPIVAQRIEKSGSFFDRLILEENQDRQLTKDEYRMMKGENLKQIPSTNRINTLAQLSISDAVKQFDSWKKEYEKKFKR